MNLLVSEKLDSCRDVDVPWCHLDCKIARPMVCSDNIITVIHPHYQLDLLESLGTGH